MKPSDGVVFALLNLACLLFAAPAMGDSRYGCDGTPHGLWLGGSWSSSSSKLGAESDRFDEAVSPDGLACVPPAGVSSAEAQKLADLEQKLRAEHSKELADLEQKMRAEQPSVCAEFAMKMGRMLATPYTNLQKQVETEQKKVADLTQELNKKPKGNSMLPGLFWGYVLFR